MFEVPEGLRYTETHEWIEPETGRVGITDFAQDELGDIVFVDPSGVGDEFSGGEEFGVVESIKAVSDLYAPVDCEIVEVNDALEGAPELVNDDPYGEGWMVRVEFDEDAVDDLLTPEEYEEVQG
ncbi:MAG: glycine cleavage system protein GcvH [Halobacteriales archaeon]